ncbi:MAG: chromate transporter [Treponema sp.]|uniref:chromate transporter n=1 Tax=Treponema sp. TaxID=166 RepID=UPI00298DEF10|nr:chromate transporter [Treponema sp.]MCR5386981.1 chromate transporter [Treponema sp.]
MNEVSLLELFFIFFYIGTFTIGGGLVAISMMKQLIVDRGLMDAETFVNMVAVSESTPGPIGINMATYIGNKFYGIPGGIVTTAGQVLPSLICILIIAKLFAKFHEKPVVNSAFLTLRPATAGLVLIATLQILEVALFNVPITFSALSSTPVIEIFRWKSMIVYGISLILLYKFKVHPLWLVLIGAVFGILFL